MEITDNLETTVRIQKNNYGYATITRETDGFRVLRHTNEPVKCGSFSITIQDGRLVSTESEAKALADEWASVEAPNRKRTRRSCHFCGLPLKGRWCDECGPQIEISF